MSEEQTQVQVEAPPPPTPKKPRRKWSEYPLWMRWAVVVCAVLFAFWFQSWWGGRQKEGIRREMLARATKALAYASPIPSRRDPNQTREWCAGLAKAGEFERVTFTDVDGIVLASTDRGLDGTTLKETKDAPAEPRIERIGERLVATVQMKFRGQPIGALRVEIKP